MPESNCGRVEAHFVALRGFYWHFKGISAAFTLQNRIFHFPGWIFPSFRFK